MDSLIVISLFYLFFGVTILSSTLYSVFRKNDMSLFDCFGIMFSFAYGFIPAIVFYFEGIGERNLYYYDYSNNGIFHIYCAFILKIVIYLIIKLAYSFVFKKKQKESTNHKHRIIHYDECLFWAGLLSLIVGFVSIYLWTKAYGNVFNFIQNADAIRASRGSVDNSLAFMQHFASLVLVSFYALLGALLTNKPKGIKMIFHLILVLLSLFGVIIYLLCSSSRVIILFAGIATCLLIMKCRRTKSIKPYIIVGGVALIFVFALATSLDAVLTPDSTKESSNIFHVIIKEFRFTVSSEMISMNKLSDGSLKLKFLDDLVNSLFAWIPERLTPFERPLSVWTYNTFNFTTTLAYGQSPSDLVATSIYEFGYLGPILFPLIVGWMIGFLDYVSTDPSRSNSYLLIVYVAFANRVINFTSHTQLSSFVLGCFSLFLFALIYNFCRLFAISKNKIESKVGSNHLNENQRIY